MTKKIYYSIVDVFTDTPFAGNPLAVVHDGSELSTDEMQKIATEFGFSESSVICAPKNDQTNAEVRIFTPHEEIPFAGHPNVGTAWVVANKVTAAHYNGSENLIFDEKGGIVDVTLKFEDGTVKGAEIVAPQSVEIHGHPDFNLMAECLGLDADNLIPSDEIPSVASVGLPFAFVEIDNIESLGAIKLNLTAFEKAAEQGPQTVDGFCVCAFAVTNEDGHNLYVRSRVFSPLGSPTEDPATGSASGALGALLAQKYDRSPATINITQGIEMGRKSDITITIKDISSQPKIAGSCVLVSEGVLYL